MKVGNFKGKLRLDILIMLSDEKNFNFFRISFTNINKTNKNKITKYFFHCKTKEKKIRFSQR